MLGQSLHRVFLAALRLVDRRLKAFGARRHTPISAAMSPN
jgi:hypothetical protein